MNIRYQTIEAPSLRKDIIDLYNNVRWELYTEDADRLINGITHSLEAIGAFHEDELVGLIRAVGDKYTVVYIQDLLVHTDFQREGIGTHLVQIILEKYKAVRQIVLLADQSEGIQTFYEKLGFTEVHDLFLNSFMYVKK